MKVIPEESRALVTGGAGFVGSHLCERLLSERVHVTCLDNFSTGTLANIEHLVDSSQFELLTHDVTVPIEANVDRIYNLACPASPDQYQRDPVQTVKANVYGIINMLDLARRAGATLLQASTSEVYGDPEVHPQAETYFGLVNPIGPRACYDEGKRCAETLCFDYTRQYAVCTRVARIFNTYGPRMQPTDGRVVSNFICAALRNEALNIYGSGEQTRSFCYIDDMVEGLLRLMQSHEECAGPVNLGNPEEVTVQELAVLIIDLTGSKSPIRITPRVPDDPRRRRPNIDLAKRSLNWAPKVGLREGLGRTIEYFAERLAAESRSAKRSRCTESQVIAARASSEPSWQTGASLAQ
jgi:UDP-glucuronate decarboxylase